MSEPKSGEQESESVRAIRRLVRLMKKYDLTAIDFAEGETEIRLRRRGPEMASVAYAPVPVALPAAPVASLAAPVAPTPPPVPAGIVIESPMVGTFYASISPDAPDYVSVGAQVRPDSTVCVIEAMKVFTDIPAGVTGSITEVLVKSGQPVEYGQPLFRVTPA